MKSRAVLTIEQDPVVFLRLKPEYRFSAMVTAPVPDKWSPFLVGTVWEGGDSLTPLFKFSPSMGGKSYHPSCILPIKERKK